ncbi:hypothetical protein [Pyrococcus woesei]|uniref:hypothetical protein n=1 Tax=Pyrococcus woesei TaxID=2262 RepID=UPI003D2F115D
MDTISRISSYVAGKVVKYPGLKYIAGVAISYAIHKFEESGLWRSVPIDKYIQLPRGYC